MTLRDWFAGQALPAVITQLKLHKDGHHEIDRVCYELADANGLFTAIIKRLYPHFPAGTRDLEWDVLPSTIGAIAKEVTALRARVAELERDLEMQTTRCIEREERLSNMDACWRTAEQRNAELVAALRDACAKSDGRLTTTCVLAILDSLARAESKEVQS